MQAQRLHALRVATKERIRELTSQRAGHALAALEGDAQAIAAIDAIDSERYELHTKLETIDQALQVVHQRERDAMASAKVASEHVARYVATVTDRRERAAWRIERGGCTPLETAQLIAAADPAAIARELESPLFDDVATREAAVRELMAKATLPPMPHALAVAAQRLGRT